MFEYRELAPIIRRLVRIRAKLTVKAKERCGSWIHHTHIHFGGGMFKPGTIHLAQRDFDMSRDSKAALLIHEAIHVKLGIGKHTQNFWNLQREFITDLRFLELCFNGRSK